MKLQVVFEISRTIKQSTPNTRHSLSNFPFAPLQTSFESLDEQLSAISSLHVNKYSGTLRSTQNANYAHKRNLPSTFLENYILTGNVFGKTCKIPFFGVNSGEAHSTSTSYQHIINSTVQYSLADENFQSLPRRDKIHHVYCKTQLLYVSHFTFKTYYQIQFPSSISSPPFKSMTKTNMMVNTTAGTATMMKHKE